MTPTTRTAFGESFTCPPGYLNTASVGIPPRPALDAVRADVEQWGAGDVDPGGFDDDVELARAGFARLIGVPTSTVATGSTVSQFVGLVAAALPDGARVVVPAGEFTSAVFPFAAQAGRGVTVTEVALSDVPAAAASADLVAASVVQSADGALLDLDALRRARADTGTPVLLDATQAAGWLPLSLDWADHVVCTGYKWLLAPRGITWFAARDDARARLVPHGAGWYAGDDPWTSVYGLPLRLADDARALNLSPSWLSVRGGAVSVPWLASLDRDALRAHGAGLADLVRAELGMAPVGSPIVALEVPDAAVARVTAAGVHTASRAGRMRLSFHLYNTEDDVRAVLDALRG